MSARAEQIIAAAYRAGGQYAAGKWAAIAGALEAHIERLCTEMERYRNPTEPRVYVVTQEGIELSACLADGQLAAVYHHGDDILPLLDSDRCWSILGAAEREQEEQHEAARVEWEREGSDA